MADHKKETKKLILETARDVFAAFGYEGARVDMIAQKAGVNKAGIYYHIGDKEKLYEAVLKETFTNIFDHIVKGVAKKKTPEEKMRFYIRGFIQNMDAHPYLPPIMLREIASGGKNISKPLAGEFSKIINCLADILKMGEEKGVFIKTTPIVVHFMIISTNAYLLMVNPKVMFVESGLNDFFKQETFPHKETGEIERLVMRSILNTSATNPA